MTATATSTDTDVLVVGGGAVGLAIARAVALDRRDVLLIEKNTRLGMETSSRNSEVIHAGLYYAPGSMKAKLCVQGKAMLYAFAAEAGVPVDRCGKLLVAVGDDESDKLTALCVNAKRNGVDDLKTLSAAEAMALEPELHCTSACLSPSTGVIDSHRYMQALEGHIESLGGAIVLNTEAIRISRRQCGAYEVTTDSLGDVSTLTAKALVLAGGLGATTLAKLAPFPPEYQVPETYFAKGHYFSISGRMPFRHLVYPMPAGTWLGVHFTRDVSGRGKLGPDFEWVDAPSYDLEDRDGAKRVAFAAAARRYWPGVTDRDLEFDYSGVRPKTSRTSSNTADFLIHGPAEHGLGGVVALYGIESPGLTSSLAIGDHVVRLLNA